MTDMTKTLDEQIEARRQEARDKKIFEKAQFILETLGEKSNGHPWHEWTQTVFRDEAAAFVVARSHEITREEHDYDDREYGGWTSISHEHRLAVSFKEERVFGASSFDEKGFGSTPKIEAYAPGAWEEKLDQVYLRARQVAETRKVAAAQKAAQEKAEVAQRAAAQKQAAEKVKRKQWGL